MSKKGKNSKLVALIFKPQGQEALMVGIQSSAVTTTLTDPSQAIGVLEDIEAKAKAAGVKLEDAVVVYKTPDNSVKIKQTKDITAAKGAGWGSFWGLLAGLILGGPLAGLLWGLGIGAVYGGVVDHGIDDKFLKNVGNALDKKGSAILLLVRADDYTPEAKAYLESFEAELHVADFSEAAEQAVLKAGEDAKVSEAVQSEFSDD